ncbi:MAG: hypothetical protein ACRD68_18885, partial [Pyrinomonadaceae bacterium]
VSTVTQLTVLGRLRALGLPPALAERQSFASAVRVTFLLSAGICFVVVLTSLVRGRDEVLDDRENLAAVGSSR